MTDNSEITIINEVMDCDDTVAFFEINKTHEGQNTPFTVIMNYEDNPELAQVHQWYTDNNKPIPKYSSVIEEG